MNKKQSADPLVDPDSLAKNTTNPNWHHFYRVPLML